MRKLRLVALALPSLASLVVLVVAVPGCEDSGASSGNPFTVPEGGVFETGTGFDGGPLPDGAPGDGATADTFVPPKGVTVTVIDVAGPKKDVRVIFHDAAGLVVGETTTDAAGKAKVASPPSMVTVLYAGQVDRPTPVTFTGVTDGDNLVVSPKVFPAETSIGTFAVTWTAGGDIANANSFAVTGGQNCQYGFAGFGETSTSVVLRQSCVAAQNAVLAEASNGGGFVAFAFAKNVAKPAANGSTAVGLTFTNVAGARTLTATNLPANGAISKRGSLAAIANNQSFFMSQTTGAIDTVPGVTFRTPVGFADAYQAYVSATMHGAAESESAIVRREAAAAAATATLANVDYATSLAFITASVAAPTPARPDITVTPAAALTGADAGVVRIGWYDFMTNKGGSWTFVVAPTTTTFKVPALPANASAFLPGANPGVDSAYFFDSSQVPSYAAAKLLPITPDFDLDVLDTNRPLPAVGTLRVSRFQPGGGER